MCEIYNKNASVLSFEELYRCTHEVVHSCDVLTIGMLTILCCISMEIYCTMVFRRWWRLTFIQYVSSVVLVYEFIQVAKLVAMSSDDQLLSQMCKQWKAHQVTMVMVRDILMYMDRTFALRW